MGEEGLLNMFSKFFIFVEKLGIAPIESLDFRLAASLIEAIGDASVKIASKSMELNGTKPSEVLRRLFLDFQTFCYNAHEQTVNSFVRKDIALAQNVRNIHDKIEKLVVDIEKASKKQPVEVMTQILVSTSFLKGIYEYSVDLADLIV